MPVYRIMVTLVLICKLSQIVLKKRLCILKDYVKIISLLQDFSDFNGLRSINCSV